eukprot:gene11227-13753_t
MSKPHQTSEVLTYEGLEKWTREKLDKMLGMPSNEIVKYIFQLESNSDIQSYLIELLGQTKKTKDFYDQLEKKINSLPRRVTKFQKLVQPPQQQQQQQSSNRLNIKSSQQQQQQTTTSSEGSNKPKKTKKSIASFKEIDTQIKYGEKCDCQATKHSLITNCLNCGKIICEQEGKGPYQRNTVAQQELEYKKQLQQEKNTTRITIDFVGRRILSASPMEIKVDKLNFDDSNSNNKNNSNQQHVEVSASKNNQIKEGIHYKPTATESTTKNVSKDTKEKSNDKKKNNKNIDSNNNNNNTKQNKGDSKVVEQQQHKSLGIITKQYYGVDDDLLVMTSTKTQENRKPVSSSLKFKGIMEGIWCQNIKDKKLPKFHIYQNYIQTMKQKDCNYFVISPDHYYENNNNISTLPPKEVEAFLKQLNTLAIKNGITLNIALIFPREFAFSAPESLETLKKKIAYYQKEIGIKDFTLVLPSGFDAAFSQPICAPNTTKTETNNAKSYSQCQTVFINQLFDSIGVGSGLNVGNLLVCPSFFEISLKTAPTRQQIEYWREISKNVNHQSPIIFTTPNGILTNQLLGKIQNIFEKRPLIVIEKYPYGIRKQGENRIYWDPYQCEFIDHDSLLTGVLASPFDLQLTIDNLSTIIPISTFLQYLQSPANYQSMTSLRANILEMTGDDRLSEDFADLILALSNGILEQLLSSDKSSTDPREQIFFNDLLKKCNHIQSYFVKLVPNDPIVNNLQLISNTLKKFSSSN